MKTQQPHEIEYLDPLLTTEDQVDLAEAPDPRKGLGQLLFDFDFAIHEEGIERG
jgi:hypothetical protein